MRYDRLPKEAKEREQYALTVGEDGIRLFRALLAADAPARLRRLPQVEVLRQVWVQQILARRDRRSALARAQADPRPAQPTDDGPLPGRPLPAGAGPRFDHHALVVGGDRIPPRSAGPLQPQARQGRVGRLQGPPDRDLRREPADVIVHVATTPAPEQDIDALERIHADLTARSLAPAEHLVDGGYVTPATIHRAVAAGNSRSVVATELNLGDAYRYAGDLDTADALYRAALDTARSAYPELVDFALQHFGKHLMEKGELAAARTHLQESLQRRIAKGDTELIESTGAAIRRVEMLIGRAGNGDDEAARRSQQWNSWLQSRTTARTPDRWAEDFPAIRDAVRDITQHQRVRPVHLRDQPFPIGLVAAMAQEAEEAVAANGYVYNGKWNAAVGNAANRFAGQVDLAALVARATGLEVERPHTAVYIAYLEEGAVPRLPRGQVRLRRGQPDSVSQARPPRCGSHGEYHRLHRHRRLPGVRSRIGRLRRVRRGAHAARPDAAGRRRARDPRQLRLPHARSGPAHGHPSSATAPLRARTTPKSARLRPLSEIPAGPEGSSRVRLPPGAPAGTDGCHSRMNTTDPADTLAR